MKRNKIFLLGLLLGLIFNLHAQDIKLMSFNMQQPYNTNWPGRVANAASILNTHQPDIVGTQELHAYMRDEVLSRVPGLGYASYGRARECDGSGEASFIFYKTSKYEIDAANSGTFWFKDDYLVCGRGYDPDYNRICTYARFREKATNKYFYVYNSHFPMTSMPEARKKSASLLLQRAINRTIKDPVIFTGDFNSWESEGNPIEYIKNGTTLKMRDTWRDVYPTGNVETGFGTRLDFIFIENKTTNSTLSTYVVKDPVASDHYPIVATVRIGGVVVNIPYGQYIWLQNSGKYVSSNNGTSPMTCDRPSVQGWEKFYVVNAGGGKVALRGSNGRYVCSENGTSAMTCNRPSYSDWEKFTWVTVSSNQVALLGSNGRYVSSENGLTAMNCNRPSIDGWEKFTYGITSAGRLEMSDEIADEKELRYFPNPVSSTLNYQLPTGISKHSIHVRDYSGKVIMNNTIAESETDNSIDMSHLSNGFYIIQISDKGFNRTFKIQKQ